MPLDWAREEKRHIGCLFFNRWTYRNLEEDEVWINKSVPIALDVKCDVCKKEINPDACLVYLSCNKYMRMSSGVQETHRWLSYWIIQAGK